MYLVFIKKMTYTKRTHHSKLSILTFSLEFYSSIVQYNGMENIYEIYHSSPITDISNKF